MKLLTRIFDRFRKPIKHRLEKPTFEMAAMTSPTSVMVDVSTLRSNGNDLIASGDMVQAEVCFREALRQNPNDPKSLVCLGYVLKEQEKFSEAVVALKRAIATSNQAPDTFETHYLLGQIVEQQGDLTVAAKHFSESLRLKPDFSRACKDLCRIYRLQGSSEALRELLESCITFCPSCPDYRILAAEFCESEINYEGVVNHLTVAVDLGVRTASTYMTLGACLCRVDKVNEGMQYMALAEAMDPGVACMTQFEMGYFQLKAGNFERGLDHLERSISLQPDFLAAHSAILMTLSHASGEGKISYQDAGKRFAQAAKRQIKKPLPGRPPRVADASGMKRKKLRVGFVSGDFRAHPVTHFLRDVLQYLDRSILHLVAYSNNPIDDAATATIKPRFDEWYSIRSLTDDDAAALIFSHEIDILVDLAGHTGESRVAIFARRPAQTQVAWLGFWASTGLEEMDYIFADTNCVPHDSIQWFSEKVYRLPNTRLCMAVPQVLRDIPIAKPPCQSNGYITFGCFQQTAKITPCVLSVWAEVMSEVPQSRLRVQAGGINIPSIRDKLLQNMTQVGIDLSRVHLLGSCNLEPYLEAHNEVDILLDTFPYTGGTTTAFALWMGVPTITLAGDSMLSRQGASMLQCVGLSEWIARSQSEYVDVAARMTLNPSYLEIMRLELRRKTVESPLFDTQSFANDFQAALFHINAERAAEVVES